jgi:oligosaccharide reducing-end xylanase
MFKNCYVWRVPFGCSLRFCRLGLVAVALAASTGCTSTVDSLGHDEGPPVSGTEVPPSLAPLHGPDTYDNAFKDVLANLQLTNKDIDDKVEGAFQQLFHGSGSATSDVNNPTYQAIFFPDADDEAYIYDVYHRDIRTEGLGLGMLIAVELDHQPEFDQLWNYAKREKKLNSGPSSGYYNSGCDQTSTVVIGCLDPYGLQMFAMALIFAHDRWRTSALGNIDYETDALSLLDVMLNKERANGGIVDGITNTFDAETSLVFDEPKTSAAWRTRPSILMPAFYELWAQATGNSFFSSAADAARAFFGHLEQVDPIAETGLIPLRAAFDGTPVPDSDKFQAEAYRVFPNLVLDEIWSAGAPSNANEFNTILKFFLSQGFAKYGAEYTLDGTVLPDKTEHEIALVLVNGVSAARSTIADSDRQRFIQAVWDMDTPVGEYRYFQGMMQLFALCILSGKMQVY